jgi:formylglycine-generating enzyme required for sulfatase activity
MSKPTVFISYSHKDEAEKEALLTHLGGLQRTGLIQAWSDDWLGPGATWEQDIEQVMAQARIAVLLITAHFLDSEFIMEREVPALLARQQGGELVIFPVIARACAWPSIDWLRQINVRPKNGVAVWREGGRYVDEELARIAGEIAALIEKMAEEAPYDAVRSRYLAHLLDRYHYLDFRGMGVSDRIPLRLPLVEMYVPLKARIELPEGETWARGLRLAGRKISSEETEVIGQRLSEPQSVLALLQQHNGLIVLGDPGSGKTTFLKYLALRLARGEDEVLGVGPRLPVLVPLSAYANALAVGDVPLTRFIADYYRDRGLEMDLLPGLAEALRQGEALLLLDGLDEVKEPARRRLVIDRVVDFFCLHRRQGNKFIITSRIVGYREVRPAAEGLVECTLVDFETAEIVEFIDRWTAAMEQAARGETPVAKQEAVRERAELLAAVERNPGVRGLAANPLLLTILALMKRQGVTLPERRVELYQKYVETLLKNWNLARGLDRPASRDLDVVETIRVLAPLALWMHETSPGVGLVKREAMRRKLVEIYTNRGESNPEQAARQLLQDAREFASLLLERGAGEYGFIHLTFQEYLAAVAIAQRGQRALEPVVETLAGQVGDDSWREVILLTIGYMGIIQQRDEAAGEVVRHLIRRSPGERGQAIVRAAEAVVDAWPGGVDAASKDVVVTALTRTLAAGRRVKAVWRAAAGVVLAQLEDPRPGVGVITGAGERQSRLPDLQFCYVPAGPFLMGSPTDDSQAYDDEKPAHQVELDYDYWLGRYPVTAAQFETFVAAGGYDEARYWPEASAAGEWHKGKIKRRFFKWEDEELKVVGEEEADRPYAVGEPFDSSNHPQVGITWYEALAFCRWLEEQLADQELVLTSAGGDSVKFGTLRDKNSYRLTLPSEAEWEKAARGGIQIPARAVLTSMGRPGRQALGDIFLIENPQPRRRFPWGNQPDPNRANYEPTGLQATNAVGCFPGGASPYGCEEMSGNVWEWTSSLWGRDLRNPDFSYPYRASDGRQRLTASPEHRRVLRGGSFYYGESVARCSVRGWNVPDLWGRGFGFRVAVAPYETLNSEASEL